MLVEVMAITKIGARWLKMFGKLSPESKERILNANLLKDENSFLRNFERGTDNIISKLNYISSPVGSYAPDTLNLAERQAQSALHQALQAGDRVAIQRNSRVLQNIRDPSRDMRFLQDIPDKDIGQVRIDPFRRIIHSENFTSMKAFEDFLGRSIPMPYGNDLGMLKAIMRRHEALEAVSTEKAWNNYVKNMTRYDQAELGNIRNAVNDFKSFRKINNLPITANHRSDFRKLYKDFYAKDSLIRALANVKNTGYLRNRSNNKLRTSHVNMDVLLEERRLLDRIPYDNNGGIKLIREIRNKEYEYLNNAGNYNSASKVPFDKRNARIVRKNTGKPFQVGNENWFAKR